MDITDCPASCYEALFVLLLFSRVKSVVYTLYGPDTESKLKALKRANKIHVRSFTDCQLFGGKQFLHMERNVLKENMHESASIVMKFIRQYQVAVHTHAELQVLHCHTLKFQSKWNPFNI